MLGSTWRDRMRTRPTPAMRAAATKSRAATLATSVWQRRANAGAPARPIASTAPVAPTPKMTAKKSASSRPGKATAMLTPASRAGRLRRPSRNGAVPRSSPTTTAIAVAASASTTESRVATRVRQKMSRPRLSVPAQCSADGPARMLPVSTASASSVHRIGATTASTSTPTVSTVAARPSGVRSTLVQRAHQLSPPGSSSGGRAARGPRRRRCSRAARRRRRRARWPAPAGSPC